MTVKALLLDDERIIVDDLAAQLAKHDDWAVAGAFTSYLDAVAACRRERPDVCFLDIEMPGADGLSVAKDIAAVHPSAIFVFVTAYPQYAAAAYRVAAIDYLVKPVSASLLNEACARVEAAIKTGARDAGDALKRTIAVKSARRIDYVHMDQIVAAKAAGNYVALITEDGEFLQRMTISDFERIASPLGFIRTHRSYIVNARFIKSAEIAGGLKSLHLAGDISAPVSAAFRRDVEIALEKRFSP